MSIFGNASGIMPGRQRTGGRAARRENIIQSRVTERRRELELREKENERIGRIKERIDRINSSTEINADVRRNITESLQIQIEQIYKAREAREALAFEAEMKRKHMLINDPGAPEERPESKQVEVPKEPEEAAREQEQQKLFDLTRIAASKENLAEKQRVRAGLAMEAGHLQRAMESPNSNTVKVGSYSGLDINEVVISAHSGFGGDDFRNGQYNKLMRGISGLDAAIKATVSGMYRESAKAQKEYLAHRRAEENHDEE